MVLFWNLPPDIVKVWCNSQQISKVKNLSFARGVAPDIFSELIFMSRAEVVDAIKEGLGDEREWYLKYRDNMYRRIFESDEDVIFDGYVTAFAPDTLETLIGNYARGTSGSVKEACEYLINLASEVQNVKTADYPGYLKLREEQRTSANELFSFLGEILPSPETVENALKKRIKKTEPLNTVYDAAYVKQELPGTIRDTVKYICRVATLAQLLKTDPAKTFVDDKIDVGVEVFTENVWRLSLKSPFTSRLSSIKCVAGAWFKHETNTYETRLVAELWNRGSTTYTVANFRDEFERKAFEYVKRECGPVIMSKLSWTPDSDIAFKLVIKDDSRFKVTYIPVPDPEEVTSAYEPYIRELYYRALEDGGFNEDIAADVKMVYPSSTGRLIDRAEETDWTSRTYPLLYTFAGLGVTKKDFRYSGRNTEHLIKRLVLSLTDDVLSRRIMLAAIKDNLEAGKDGVNLSPVSQPILFSTFPKGAIKNQLGNIPGSVINTLYGTVKETTARGGGIIRRKRKPEAEEIKTEVRDEKEAKKVVTIKEEPAMDDDDLDLEYTLSVADQEKYPLPNNEDKFEYNMDTLTVDGANAKQPALLNLLYMCKRHREVSLLFNLVLVNTTSGKEIVEILSDKMNVKKVTLFLGGTNTFTERLTKYCNDLVKKVDKLLTVKYKSWKAP